VQLYSGLSGATLTYTNLPPTEQYYVTYTLGGCTAFSPLGPDSQVDASGQTANLTILPHQTVTIAAGLICP